MRGKKKLILALETELEGTLGRSIKRQNKDLIKGILSGLKKLDKKSYVDIKTWPYYKDSSVNIEFCYEGHSFYVMVPHIEPKKVDKLRKKLCKLSGQLVNEEYI